MRTTPRGDRLERCKVDANEPLPFACPEGCVFYEPRKVSQAGWHVAPRDDEDEAADIKQTTVVPTRQTR